MKNVFYFILKAFFVLKIFRFLSRHFGVCRENSLILKIRLTSKFMTSQPGLETIPIHILLNVSQSKNNQTIKFGQLIKHDNPISTKLQHYFSSSLVQTTEERNSMQQNFVSLFSFLVQMLIYPQRESDAQYMSSITKVKGNTKEQYTIYIYIQLNI